MWTLLLPAINEVIFLLFWELNYVAAITCSSYESNILSLSACSVLSLVIASPIDCSALVIADGRLTQGEAVPAGWPRHAVHSLAFSLQRDTCLLLFQAVLMAKDATGCGILSKRFQKAGFRNEPWVPWHSPFCRWYPRSVVLRLLTITARWPTVYFLTLWHFPIRCIHLCYLSMCIHTLYPYWHSPCWSPWLDGALMFSHPSSFYAFSSLLCYNVSWCPEKQLWM